MGGAQGYTTDNYEEDGKMNDKPNQTDNLPDDIRRKYYIEKVMAKAKEAPFGWAVVCDPYGDPIAYFKSQDHALFYMEALRTGQVDANVPQLEP